jgi:RNA polymerase sigma factor (sigma-70 family)
LLMESSDRGNYTCLQWQTREPLTASQAFMSDPAEQFAALLDRARQGDEQALEQLSRQYEPKLRVVARVLLGPALRPYLDSMDLVQSVHRSLILGLRQNKFEIAAPENLLALALTLVRRKAARQWRHLQRQTRLEARSTQNSSVAQVLTSLSSPQADPAQEAQFRDQVEHLYGSLDDVDRRIVELRLAGYATAEIACQLDLNAVTLRVRMTRLRQRLRAAGVLDEWL